jgi:hypothetical protein
MAVIFIGGGNWSTQRKPKPKKILDLNLIEVCATQSRIHSDIKMVK